MRHMSGKKARFEGIYEVDNLSQIKLSNDNPIVQNLYNGFLKGKEHKLLYNHPHHEAVGCGCE